MNERDRHIPDCCQVKELAISALCPHCKNKGKTVKGITIASLVNGERLRELESTEEFRFCATQSCKLAYFNFNTGEVISKTEVTVRIGIKETSSPRMACYCFSHTVESIEEEVRESGQSVVPQSITEHCRFGRDRCSELNPKGSCCLGDINKIIQQAQVKTNIKGDS